MPPEREQGRIADAIESHITRLDDAVATLKRVERNLERYRASVLKSAVEGRLVPTEAALAKQERRTYEPASVLLDRIRTERRRRWTESGKKGKYEEPTAPDTTNLPSLPEGWYYVRVPTLLLPTNEGMKTGPFGSLLKKHEHRQEGVPVLGIENIEPMRFVLGSKIHITAEKADQLCGYDVEPGDLLISRSGTVGQVCVVPEALGPARFSTNVMRVRFLKGPPIPAFFALLLNGSPFVRSQISDLCKGTTRDFLNQEILSTLVFPLPPLAEQARILDEVTRLVSVADTVAGDSDTTLLRAQRLRQAILKWAFEGKLADQDPNDEPATVLLERIKGERAVATSTPVKKATPVRVKARR